MSERALAAVTGVCKAMIAVLTMRAGFMQLGPRASQLRRAFLLAGIMLLFDGIFFLLYALNAPAVVQVTWLAALTAFSVALCLLLWVRRRIHRRALRSGHRDPR